MIRLLHLSHHKHSGRLLAHHHTSYRGLFVVLVTMGVALLSIQSTVHADNLSVFAKISSIIPSVAAVILDPPEGKVYTSPNTTVSGTCEYIYPASVVVIKRNNQNVGSTICQSNNTFSAPLGLSPGQNTIIARTMNMTDDYGPDSGPVHVVYTAPVVTPPTPNPGGGSTGTGGGSTGATGGGTSGSGGTSTISGADVATESSGGPANETTDTPEQAGNSLQIGSQQTYLMYGKNQAVTWEYSISGGTIPYSVRIDWGDGKIEDITVSSSEPQTISHAYAGYAPSFATMTVDDSVGGHSEYAIAVFSLYNPQIFGSTSEVPDTPFLQTQQGSFAIVYAAYVGTLGVAALAWYDAHIVHIAVSGLHIFPKHPGTPAFKGTDTLGKRRFWRLKK